MSKKSTFNKIIGDIDKYLDENLESYKEIKRNLKETFGKEKSDENIKEDKDILFCTKCGAEMDQDDLFCQSCGAKRKKEKVQSKNKEEPDVKVEEEIKQTKKTKKESVYKCPNCGSSLESYTSDCPYCHTELRNIKPSESMENFSKGLEKIKSKEMPKYEGKESLLKKTIGIDLSKDIEAREAFESSFRRKINAEVANYINNYPIPNSKEDLIEFMILVTSNITTKDDCPTEIKKAWESKMEQIYKQGTEQFVQFFINEKFKCSKVEYHSKKNRIKYMLFEQI